MIRPQLHMRKTVKMEEVLVAGKRLVASQISQSPVEALTLVCSNNTRYGELLLPRKVTDSLLGASSEQKELSVSDLNERIATYPEHFFSGFTLNPKCHLFIKLNRPFVYAWLFDRIFREKDSYGTTTKTDASQNITLIPHVLCSDHVTNMSLSEARSLLTLGLLRNLLMASGDSVNVYLSNHCLSQYQLPNSSTQLFGSFFKDSTTREATREDITAKSFIALFVPPNTLTPISTPSPQAATSIASSESYDNVIVDVKYFSVSQNLVGKGGYEKILNTIQVTNALGHLTPAASLAHKLCNHCSTYHMMIHVVPLARSYHVQQTMMLVEMFNSINNSSVKQHIAPTAAVSVVLCSGKTSCSLADLIRVRRKQMAGAFTVKYNEKLKGDQLDVLATQMTDAVLKFELLSHDPTAYVNIETSQCSTDGDDVRFNGAFVLYNFARVATLLNRHKEACEQGTYPPLPPLDSVDFSLLREEEEWQLFFHFLLQYPVIVKESAQLAGKGIGVHITIGLKKICQFLCKFSHAFSSYYSRTKILMLPEPHLLPLIHARLYLMMAIKQVMYNALTMLAIKPLEQL